MLKTYIMCVQKYFAKNPVFTLYWHFLINLMYACWIKLISWRNVLTPTFWIVHPYKPQFDLTLTWRVILNFHILRSSAAEEATSRIVGVLATKTGLLPNPLTRVGSKGWVKLCILLRKRTFDWVTNESYFILFQWKIQQQIGYSFQNCLQQNQIVVHLTDDTFFDPLVLEPEAMESTVPPRILLSAHLY